MLSMIFSTLLAAAITDTFGYWLHRAIHQKWSGSLYKSHMAHHLTLYPPDDFSSEQYRNAGKDDTTRTFLLLGFPLLLAPSVLAFLGIFGWLSAVWITAVVVCVGLLNSYIHDWIHLKAHWFHFVPGSSNLVKKHLVHHQDMGKNFGIFTFFWDKVCRTYKS